MPSLYAHRVLALSLLLTSLFFCFFLGVSTSAATSTPTRRSLLSPRTQHGPSLSSLRRYHDHARRDALASLSVEYVLHLRGADEAGLTRRMGEVSRAGTGEWLSFEEVRAYAAPSEEARRAVERALHGEERVQWSRMGNAVTVRSTLARAAAQYDADLAAYEHPHARDAGSARESAPQLLVRGTRYTIPSELAEHVHAITGLLGVPQRPVRSPVRRGVRPAGDSRSQARAQSEAAPPAARDEPPPPAPGKECAPPNEMTPDCIRRLYGTKTYVAQGSDPSLAMVHFSPAGLYDTDVQAAMKEHRPDVEGYGVELVFGPGAENNPHEGGEFTFDVQLAATLVAPLPVKGIVLKGTDKEDYFATFWRYIAEMPPASRPAVTVYPFGIDESLQDGAALDASCRYAQQLTALGHTIVVSSGDHGVNGETGGECPPFRPTWPSGCEYVLSVGGTADVPERALNATLDGYDSGGGFSRRMAMPAYQKDAVGAYLEGIGDLEKGNFDPTKRAFPDIAAQAGVMPYYFNAKPYVITGGTSSASVIAGSIFSLLNSARAGLTPARGVVGQPHGKIYGDAGALGFADIEKGQAGECFRDEEGPDGKKSKVEHALPARQGWDPVTGWGTPLFIGLRALFYAA